MEYFDFNRCDNWHLIVHMDVFAAFLNAIQGHGLMIDNEQLSDGGNRLRIAAKGDDMYERPKLPPFTKDFPQKDNWPKGKNNKSYQYAENFVQPFNNNVSDRAPTTSTSEYKPISKDKFLKMPFKG